MRFDQRDNHRQQHIQTKWFTMLTSSRMHFSSVAIRPRQASQIFRFLFLFLEVSTSQNRSSSTAATRKSPATTSPCLHVSCFEHTQPAPNTIWSKNESERTTPKMDFKLYTLYILYTIFTQLKNTVTEGNFMKKATRGIVQDGGHPHVNWNKLRKPTSAHTNRPKLYRKIEQWLPFHKRQKSPSKSGFFVYFSSK